MISTDQKAINTFSGSTFSDFLLFVKRPQATEVSSPKRRKLAESPFKVGRNLYKEQKFRAALPLLLKALQNNNKEINDGKTDLLLNMLGKCYYKLNEYKSALQ